MANAAASSRLRYRWPRAEIGYGLRRLVKVSWSWRGCRRNPQLDVAVVLLVENRLLTFSLTLGKHFFQPHQCFLARLKEPGLCFTQFQGPNKGSHQLHKK